uniref:NTF2 fold protein loop-helix-loop design NT-9 n=1 Tax=synthetic construct TaxID=32630 RepID=UPI001606F4BC|nr:Chain A, NTF2 fold protein loop-helix-loop design NT-9 [synthetic construct]
GSHMSREEIRKVVEEYIRLLYTDPDQFKKAARDKLLSPDVRIEIGNYTFDSRNLDRFLDAMQEWASRYDRVEIRKVQVDGNHVRVEIELESNGKKWTFEIEVEVRNGKIKRIRQQVDPEYKKVVQNLWNNT